jgi:hypothetical protein
VPALRHFCCSRAFEKDRVCVALDLADRDTGFLGDLLDGRAGSDAGLDFAGAELAFVLDLDLAESSYITPARCAQFVVGREAKFLACFGVGAHHMRSIGFKSDHSKLSHIDLPYRAGSRLCAAVNCNSFVMTNPAGHSRQPPRVPI